MLASGHCCLYYLPRWESLPSFYDALEGFLNSDPFPFLTLKLFAFLSIWTINVATVVFYLRQRLEFLAFLSFPFCLWWLKCSPIARIKNVLQEPVSEAAGFSVYSYICVTSLTDSLHLRAPDNIITSGNRVCHPRICLFGY